MKLSNEELIKKAREEYPIGTEFIDVYNLDCKVIIEPWATFNRDGSVNFISGHEPGYGGCMYDINEGWGKSQHKSVIKEW